MHEEIREDLMRDSPCTRHGFCNEWCYIRELSLSRVDDRTGEQVRLAYDYKYEQSEKEGRDIGKERALREFFSLYAQKFDEVYKEKMLHDELYEKIFGHKRLHTDADILRHIEENKVIN